jgi:hypothetical protein
MPAAGLTATMNLELGRRRFYVQPMKRILTLGAAGLLLQVLPLAAQDGSVASAVADRQAAEERYQKLAGRLEDLAAAQDVQQKRLAELESEIRALREAQAQPRPDVAGRDDLRQLAEKIKEVDDKRAADKELILKEIEQLGQAPAAVPSKKIRKPAPPAAGDGDAPAGGTAPGGDKKFEGFEYVIQKGDTLSAVVTAYREKGVKVTVDQVLKHPLNAKVDPAKLRVGQKIFIPGAAK